MTTTEGEEEAAAEAAITIEDLKPSASSLLEIVVACQAVKWEASALWVEGQLWAEELPWEVASRWEVE